MWQFWLVIWLFGGTGFYSTGVSTFPTRRGLCRDSARPLPRPDVVDYLAGVLNASIAANRVGFYRQDHNFSQIDLHWRDRIDKPRNDGRRGLAENLYIQGEFALWRRLRDANPGMKFDTCSGGGRSNDLSTLRFPSMPLHYTDTGYTNYVHKLHYHQMLAE